MQKYRYAIAGYPTFRFVVMNNQPVIIMKMNDMFDRFVGNPLGSQNKRADRLQMSGV